jgi:hypothetical protein
VVPIACVYPFCQRYFISGLPIGAVKWVEQDGTRIFDVMP